MLPNRQLLISFLVISDTSIKGKEKIVTDLNSLDILYFLDHRTHQDFTRKIWGNIFYSKMKLKFTSTYSANSRVVSSFY
jgi:hypothetical protein